MSIPFLSRAAKIITICVRRYTAVQHSQRAVALTYYTLFSIVPLAALLFGIAKGFDLDNRLRELLTVRFQHHKELLGYIYQFADTTLKQAQGGIVAGVGIIALFWTVISLANNIENTFNAVWRLPPRRNLMRKFSDYLALLVIMPVLLVIVSSVGVLLRTSINNLIVSMPHVSAATLLATAADLSPLVASCILFILIYFLVPNTKVRLAPAVIAGIIAGICFQLLQDGFIFMQRSLYRYNQIYGSFAILPLFLIWLQWSWQIVIFGAEIGFVTQNIDSGIFDIDPHAPPNLRRRRAHQLAMVKAVASTYNNGFGATNIGELWKQIPVTEVEFKSELDELINCGLLLRSDTGVIPGLPMEQLNLSCFLSRLEGTALSGNKFSEELQELKRLDEAVENSPANCLIKNLR